MNVTPARRPVKDWPFVAEIWSADQRPAPTEAQYEQIFARMSELHEQSSSARKALLGESDPTAKRRLYDELLQVNDALGIPTDSMEVLGVQPAMLTDRAPRIEA